MRNSIPLVVVALTFGWTGCSSSVSTDFAPLSVGSARPPIQAEGWINGDAPSDAELNGKVVVIDCWAYW